MLLHVQLSAKKKKEFGVPIKLVWLIKMRLNGTYSKVHVGKHFSDSFAIQNGLK
jgi:hypothetical protein